MAVGLMSAMLSRGTSYAPKRKHSSQVIKAAEQARKDWLNALLVDQTRAWLELGEESKELLSAFAVLLTIGGFVVVYETRTADSPALRIIRGAISAAEQCSREGSKMKPEYVQALCSGAAQAQQAIESASIDAILHAAQSIRSTIGLSDGGS